MKYLTIYTENSHYDELLQLAKNFKYIEKLETGEAEDIDEGDTKEEIIANVKAGYEEMILMKQGKLAGIPWKDFLNGLPK